MSLPSDINPQLLALSSGYNLTSSLRFRGSATANLSRTPSVASNRSVWTWSGWVKRGKLGTLQGIFGTGNTSGGGPGASYITGVTFNGSDQLFCYWGGSGAGTSTAVYRDPSAWYHLVVVANTTTLTCYINGVSAVSSAISGSGAINDTQKTTLGSFWDTAGGVVLWPNDIYMTEVNFIDGQALTPSSFGSTNTLTGVWQPARYTGSYGTNGFYLPFTDNSALTTSSNVGLGKDFSGNGNYWPTSNISITAGVTYDSMTDVPTLTSATAANFAVVNPLDAAVGTASNGNLSWTTGATNGNFRGSIAIPSSGKFYFEGTVLTTTSSSVSISLGVAPSTVSLTTQNNQSNLYQLFAAATGYVSISLSNVGTLGTFNAGDVLQVAVDVTNSKLWLGKNNVFYDSSGGTTGNPTTGANPVTTNSVVGSFPFGSCYQDTLNVNFGQRPFTYTPPTGFVALNTYNLPTSTIVKGNTVMDATLYTGTGASLSVTNAASFKPDFVWLKSRSATTNHQIFDSVRGTTKVLVSNSTEAETTSANTITSFNSGGFTVGTNTAINTNAATYVGWQWQAGQGSTSSDTNGSITSTVSVNASAGFSVVTYTGNGLAGATIGHGLGVAPSLIIVKNRSTGSTDWPVYHQSIGATNWLALNTTDASAANIVLWNDTSPTSSVFTTGISLYVNGSGSTFVAYCWTPIAGFSAFGSYTGNGSADGTFVYTGFRPKFVMIKRTDSTSDWYIWDTARDTYNLVTNTLLADTSGAETSATSIDNLSNGFKCRSATVVNASGGTYIYMAFAETPFKNSLAR